MKASLLLLSLLLALPAARAADTSGPSMPAAPSAQERVANARKAIAAANWSAAMRELNAAVRAEPQNADVHNLLGYTYRKRASPDLAKAFEHYNMALKYDPAHRGAHEYIGEAYLLQKRLPEAEQHLAELERLCGSRDCEEYRDLAKAIADFKGAN